MKTVFDSAMTAHVWAQGRQESGRNPARRVFFEGPFLYSYGRHFLTGYLCPDGAAFLNSDSYSVSTSRHQSDARAATRGRSYSCPDLKTLASFMDSELFRRPVWANREGQAIDSPFDSEGRHVATGRAAIPYREATPAEAKEARPRLVSLFLKAKETAPLETIAAALTYAGAKPEEAAKAAARVHAAHEKRAKEEAAAKIKKAREEAARDARAAAARPLADYEARVQEAREILKVRGNYRGAAEGQAGLLLEKAKRLFRARKEAKAKGWTRLAADLLAREKLLRAGAAGLESYSAQLGRLAYWKERKTALREGLAALQPGGMGRDFGGYAWQQKRQAVESLLQTVQAAALAPDPEAGGHWLAPLARVAGADLPRMAAGLAEVIAALQGAESRAYAGQARETRRGEVATLRAWRAAGPEGAGADLATKAASVASRYALRDYNKARGLPFSESGAYRPAIPAAYRLAGFTGESFAAIEAAAKERAAALKLEEARNKLESWRNGGPDIGRMSDAKGGALLRARDVTRDNAGAVIGGTLQTSHGASVPLAHALKAFRFLKLCREAGKAWQANGKTLAVGHFRVDSIDASGNFTAGCHRINWPEVAALAARLGVDSLAPQDTTAAKDSAHV